MFRHAMIDLETFGLRRGNALRSIAVIPFDPFTGLIAERDWWFYQNVDFASQEAVGLTKDPSTVEWWNKPEQDTAQRMLYPNQETLTASLMYFDRYLRDNFDENPRVWARGMMDQEVLEGVYDAIKRKLPYHYRAPRDTRGFLDLVEFSPTFDFNPEFEGVPHFGPDDAYHECKLINEVFRVCDLRRFGLVDEFSGYAEVVEDDQAQKFADVADVIAGTTENQATMTKLATGSLHCQSNPQMPEGWEPATANNGDPVGQYKGDWGHWDETWSEWHGGHADEAAARKALQVYCDTVLG